MLEGESLWQFKIAIGGGIILKRFHKVVAVRRTLLLMEFNKTA